MECEHCFREVAGVEVMIIYPLTLEIIATLIESTPDREWFDCQACGRVICVQYGRFPASGFCDECITKYSLSAELTELGLITEDLQC